MRCPRCGHANTPERIFCVSCASELVPEIAEQFEPPRARTRRRRQAREAVQVIHSGVERFDDGANQFEARWRSPRLDKPGRALATEVLVGTQAVRNLIRERKTHQLYSAIQMGGEAGMQLMDDSLKELYETGIISYDEAISRARDPDQILSDSGGRIVDDGDGLSGQGRPGRPQTTRQ